MNIILSFFFILLIIFTYLRLNNIYAIITGLTFFVIFLLFSYYLKGKTVKKNLIILLGLTLSVVTAYFCLSIPGLLGLKVPVYLSIFFASLIIFSFISSVLSAESVSAGDYKIAQKKILDTSVIIDGKLVDLYRTGFLEGEIIIPKFILNELQVISDSHDTLKRKRGRRGLDILQQLRDEMKKSLTIIDRDYDSIPETDSKLVELAKEMEACLLTNDFNLNKIATLQGVTVLNINDLANALKPMALPGELLEVLIVKKGKEINQGVAYLNDGTMVVVDNSYDMINKKIKVIVTSSIQTSAGRMIFAKREEYEKK